MAGGTRIDRVLVCVPWDLAATAAHLRQIRATGWGAGNQRSVGRLDGAHPNVEGETYTVADVPAQGSESVRTARCRSVNSPALGRQPMATANTHPLAAVPPPALGADCNSLDHQPGDRRIVAADRQSQVTQVTGVSQFDCASLQKAHFSESCIPNVDILIKMIRFCSIGNR